MARETIPTKCAISWGLISLATLLGKSAQDNANLWPYPSEVYSGSVSCFLTLPLKVEWTVSNTDTFPEEFSNTMNSVQDRFFDLIYSSVPYHDILSDSGPISHVSIVVKSTDVNLTAGVSEGYRIHVPECNQRNETHCDRELDTLSNRAASSHTISVHADTIWGVSHGLQTVLQLVREVDATSNPEITTTRRFAIPGCPWRIRDAPRFAHRGLLLDTARHFIPVASILRTLDAMAASRLNVFHWHIVDSQVHPIPIRRPS